MENGSDALLSPRGPHELVVRAEVLPGVDQHLEVLMDGKRILTRRVQPARLDLHLPVAAAGAVANRRVELRWAQVQRLGQRDSCPAAAQLLFLGFQS